MSASLAELGAPPIAGAPRRALPLGTLALRLLALSLAGYALAGKGFAYLGVGRVYVGEMVLALGILSVLASGAWRRLPRSPALALLLLFMAFGALRTLPGLVQHGFEALRDAVVWGYGAFAIVVAALLVSRPGRLDWLLERYRRFATPLLLLAPGLVALQAWVGDELPRIPGADVAVLQLKESDVLIQLAGVGAAQLLGFAPAPTWSLGLLLVSAAALSIYSRGAMIGFCAALGFVLAMRPRSRRVRALALAAAIAAPAALLVDTGWEVKGRAVSGRQLLENWQSMFAPGATQSLGGTSTWRLRWWSRIVDDTVHGPHFWTGRGFGVNLATVDGFDVDVGRSLRSPHNGHLTVLARMGVPGLVLWCALQLAWLREMLVAYRRSRRLADSAWPRLFLLLIACWIAHLVNATFDVYLEGPMGGIWFWTIFGVGVAAARIQRRLPSA